ncbi:MAG: hypothetical protein MGG11_18300 [Trichodesmium sp. MAG_R03]|nr:hypothetical protein [Trichodesmium sp. MAG_R03]
MLTFGLAVPIVWQMLSKKGNSQTAERLDVMKKFASLLGHQRVGYLTADREFVGKQCFKYLVLLVIGGFVSGFVPQT